MARAEPAPPPRPLAPRVRAQGRTHDPLYEGPHSAPSAPTRGRPSGRIARMKPLPPGGTIGVAAPASPYDSRSEVLRGVEWWESQGYRVKLAEHVYDRDDYVAGSPEDRATDLNALFADPEVDVVQALQGGYGSAQAIPHLDFDLIAANPKPLVGFSDITALHVAVRARTGLPTVYGNGLVGVASPEATEFTRARLLEVLTGDALGPVPPNPDDPYTR